MTNNDLILEAYRLIRIKARDITKPVSDEELGQYARGVIDLQSELYDKMTYGSVRDILENNIKNS